MIVTVLNIFFRYKLRFYEKKKQNMSCLLAFFFFKANNQEGNIVFLKCCSRVWLIILKYRCFYLPSAIKERKLKP